VREDITVTQPNAARTVYVDADWAGAQSGTYNAPFTTIASGLANASTNWVSGGDNVVYHRSTGNVVQQYTSALWSAADNTKVGRLSLLRWSGFTGYSKLATTSSGITPFTFNHGNAAVLEGLVLTGTYIFGTSDNDNQILMSSCNETDPVAYGRNLILRDINISGFSHNSLIFQTTNTGQYPMRDGYGDWVSIKNCNVDNIGRTHLLVRGIRYMGIQDCVFDRYYNYFGTRFTHVQYLDYDNNEIPRVHASGSVYSYPLRIHARGINYSGPGREPTKYVGFRNCSISGAGMYVEKRTDSSLSGVSEIQNLWFCNNTLDAVNTNPNIDLQSYAMFGQAEHTTVITDNILRSTNIVLGGSQNTGTFTDLTVERNTIISLRQTGSSGGKAVGFSSVGTYSGAIFRGNICLFPNALAGDIRVLGGNSQSALAVFTECNSNVAWASGITVGWAAGAGTGFAQGATLGSWQTATSFDSNSVISPNQIITQATGTYINANITSSNSARDRITGKVRDYIDYYGFTRIPSGTTCDAGAIEYGATSLPNYARK
jgi:hypothetical protein